MMDKVYQKVTLVTAQKKYTNRNKSICTMFNRLTDELKIWFTGNLCSYHIKNQINKNQPALGELCIIFVGLKNGKFLQG